MYFSMIFIRCYYLVSKASGFTDLLNTDDCIAFTHNTINTLLLCVILTLFHSTLQSHSGQSTSTLYEIVQPLLHAEQSTTSQTYQQRINFRNFFLHFQAVILNIVLINNSKATNKKVNKKFV